MTKKSADVSTYSDLTLQLRAEKKARDRALNAAKKKVERQLAQAKVSRDHQPFLEEAEIISRRDIADAALQGLTSTPKLDTAALVSELLAGEKFRADRLAAHGHETEATLHGEPAPTTSPDVGPPQPATTQKEAAILIAPAAEVSIWDNAFDDIVEPRTTPRHAALRPEVPEVPEVPETLSPIVAKLAYQTDNPIDPQDSGSSSERSESEEEETSDVEYVKETTASPRTSPPAQAVVAPIVVVPAVVPVVPTVVPVVPAAVPVVPAVVPDVPVVVPVVLTLSEPVLLPPRDSH